MTSPREQSEAIYSSYKKALDAIRQNAHLSAEGRKKEIAAIYSDASARMKQVLDEEKAARAEELADLENELMSPRRSRTVSINADRVTVDMSFRDALHRAASVQKPSELQTLLDRAVRHGDDLQARAVLSIALERQEVPVLNRYVDFHPDTEPSVQRLLDLKSTEFGGSLLRTGAFMTKPEELSQLGDHQIDQLAEAV